MYRVQPLNSLVIEMNTTFSYTNMNGLQNFLLDNGWSQAQGALSSNAGVFSAIGWTILSVTFMLGIYETFLAGGNLRQFGIVLLKVTIAGSLISNWNSFFTDVVAAGTWISNQINGSTVDMMAQFMADFQNTINGQQGGTSSLLQGGLSGAAVAIAETLIVFSSFAIFVLMLKILGMLFIFLGGILYCLGPMLVACAPSSIVAPWLRPWVKGLVEWAMWPALYSMFTFLMAAIGMGNYAAAMGTGGFTSATTGTNVINLITMCVVAILFGLAVCVIPFIAHAVLGASFSGVMSGISRAASAAAGVPPVASAAGNAGVAAASAGIKAAGDYGKFWTGGSSGGGEVKYAQNPPPATSPSGS